MELIFGTDLPSAKRYNALGGSPDTLGVECGMKTGIYGQLKAYEIILARVTHLGPETLYDCEGSTQLRQGRSQALA